MRNSIPSLSFLAAISLPLVASLPATVSSSLRKASLVGRDDGLDTSTDFSWIQHWAALGDSYAAGIGAGTVRPEADAASCSRYDEAYPSLMETYFGDPPSGSFRSFQFYACSGDTSKMIRDGQVPRLNDGSQDFITLSAGGNDVGFSDVLKACIFLPSSQSDCGAALQKASDMINNDLENNINDLLKAVLPKLSPNGFIIYTLYGKFFNESPGECDKQGWCFLALPPFRNCLNLTVDIRKKFNELVAAANKKILNAIDASNKWQSKKIRPVNWTGIPSALHGQFCEPGSAGDPNDPSNAMLAYIRGNTNDRGDLRKAAAGHEGDISTRSTDIFEDEGATDHKLFKRIPDDMGKLFHPTPFGHSIIASAAISEVSQAKAAQLSIGDGMGQCQITSTPTKNTPKCNGPNFLNWAGRDALVDAVSQFCNYKNIVPPKPGSTTSLNYFDTYDDAVTLSIDWASNMLLSTDKCKGFFMNIVDGCDGDVPPGWHKFGGTLTDDTYGKFTVAPKKAGEKMHLDCADPKGPSKGAYVNPDVLHANTKEFCKTIGNQVLKPKDGHVTPYSKDTYDSLDLNVEWLLPASSGTTTKISEADCNDYFNRLIDGCPGDNPNPMNWKYGGFYTVDELRISIVPTGKAAAPRVAPGYKAPIAKCDSFYQFIRDEFWIYGGGWSGSDWGSALLNNMSHCIGGNPTDWSFKYYDHPDKDGYEWVAFGHTNVLQKNCFTPVIQGAGGPNIPCNGRG